MSDRFKLLTIQDLGNLPEPKWMIEGLFEQDALVMLVGPPGSFKSFLAIDWALSLAAGRPWNGRATKPSRVLYSLGEGKASLLKRIDSWKFHNKLSKSESDRLNSNFRTTFDVPQMAVPRDNQEFIEALDMDGFSPTLLVIDTLARSFVGKNENDQTDVGIWVNSADVLRQRGMTVLVLHHTKKNTEFGLKYRGASALMGAMDTSFVLERNPEGYGGFAKLKCDKMKDREEPEDVWMHSQKIKPHPDHDGSIVLLETKAPGEEEKETRQEEQEALALIIDSLLQDSQFGSDRARARALAAQTGIPEATAHTKIRRGRKRNIQEDVDLETGELLNA